MTSLNYTMAGTLIFGLIQAMIQLSLSQAKNYSFMAEMAMTQQFSKALRITSAPTMTCMSFKPVKVMSIWMLKSKN